MKAVAALLILAGLVACSGDGDSPPEPSAESGVSSSTTSSSATSSSASTTTTTTAPPAYNAEVMPVDPARLTSSWRPGCPVGPESLQLVTLDYWGYDGVEYRGELVVHTDHATAMVEVFRQLFEARFPIERMELVDVYGGDDAASTAANNTAGFNCRDAVGNPGVWSQHAYGAAVDVNPAVNPYVRGTVVDPLYLDRTVDVPGLIRAGDRAVQAFESVGWYWGGYWASPDYQHFSATGS